MASAFLFTLNMVLVWLAKVCLGEFFHISLSYNAMSITEEKEVYDFNALKIDRIVVDKVIKW